jgi:hypothetical protein
MYKPAQSMTTFPACVMAGNWNTYLGLSHCAPRRTVTITMTNDFLSFAAVGIVDVVT